MSTVNEMDELSKKSPYGTPSTLHLKMCNISRSMDRRSRNLIQVQERTRWMQHQRVTGQKDSSIVKDIAPSACIVRQENYYTVHRVDNDAFDC